MFQFLGSASNSIKLRRTIRTLDDKQREIFRTLIPAVIFLVFFIGFVDALHADIPDAIMELPLYEWRAISLNTLSDVDPCPARPCAWSGVEGQSGVVNDWTGGAFAERVGALGGLVYFGGGHNGYYGNEVYVFDLQTLMWQRRSDPTDGQTPGDAYTMDLDANCRYWDGAPVSTHTYDSVVYDPVGNRFIMLTPADASSSRLPGRADGCSSTTPAIFDFGENMWCGALGNDSCRAKSVGPASLKYGPTAYDPKRRLFWGRTGFRYPRLFVSYNPATDEWAQYDDDSIEIDAVGAVDPNRDLFVSLNFRATPNVGVRNLADPSLSTVIVNTGGDTQIESLGKGPGFEWSQRLNAFIAWNNGRDLYTLKPPSGDWRTGTWIWTRYAATGSDPGIAMNNCYSKFQWVDALGIAIIAPRADGPVYAVRMIEGSDHPDKLPPSRPTGLRVK